MKLNNNKKSGKKFLVWFIGICLISLILFYFFSQAYAGDREPPFETALVQRGDLSITVSSTGSLAAKGTVEIGTRISGSIDTLSVDYNDKVKKGDILATLDQALLKAELLSVKAAVASSKAKLEQAQIEYDRNLSLNKKGFLSDEEFLVFKTNLAVAKASLASDQAALSRAKINLNFTVIRAPIDGTIIERSVEVGQTVAASLSTPTLFIIAEDLSQMQIEVDVDESDIGLIKVGQTAEFEVAAYPDRKFKGEVNQIRLSPETISNVVTYTVVIESENNEGILLPGMTATVDFVIEREKNALLVPDAALLVSLGREKQQKDDSSKDQSFIYLLNRDQPPQRILVEKGISDGSKTVVTGEDLQEGMRIITSVKTEAKTQSRGIFSKLMPGPRRKGGGEKK